MVTLNLREDCERAWGRSRTADTVVSYGGWYHCNVYNKGKPSTGKIVTRPPSPPYSIPTARACAKLQRVSQALTQDRSLISHQLTRKAKDKGNSLTVKTSSSPSSASLWMVEDDVVEPKRTKNVIKSVSKEGKSNLLI